MAIAEDKAKAKVNREGDELDHGHSISVHESANLTCHIDSLSNFLKAAVVVLLGPRLQKGNAWSKAWR